MNNSNPMERDKSMNQRSWNANAENDRLGFINRDAQVSESISSPMVVYPLGKPFIQDFARFNTTDQWAASSYATWTNRDVLSYPAQSIPGIMTFSFDPIFAAGRFESKSGQNDIFVNLWEELRIYNTMTESFEHGDLQALTVALCNIEMHIENIRRALKIMRRCYMSATNAYHSPEALIYAAGWRMSEKTMRYNFIKWANYFNQSIVGNFNNIKWFKDIIPGSGRWKSLVTEIYKDTSANTDYCQLYMFKPKNLWMMTWAPFDATQKKRNSETETITPTVKAKNGAAWTWSISEFQPSGTYPTPLWDLSEDADEAANIVAFENYMELVAQTIRDTFFDSGALTIMAILNAIKARNNSAPVDIVPQNVEFLDIASTEEIPLTWDFKMMLAIENMAPAKLRKTSARVNPSTGNMEQEFYLTNNTYSKYLALATRPVNLPCFGATNADFVNALQWTFSVDGNSLNGDPIDSPLPSSSFGTEIIDHIDVIWIERASNGDQWPIRWEYAPYLTLEETAINPSDATPGMQQRTILTANCFAFYPTIYNVNYRRQGDTIIQQNITYVLNDFEVMYAADPSIINDTHNQFVNNFYGFPTRVPTEGSPKFETGTDLG